MTNNFHKDDYLLSNGYSSSSSNEVSNLTRPTIVIAGCGLVGALNAVFFSKTNKFDILILEKRSDIRLEEHTAGRSINLALSYRGICALKEVGLDKVILKNAIPMTGRMIHRLDNSQVKFPYGTSDQCLYSLDRKLLNEQLMTYAENSPNVEVKFNCSIESADLHKQKLTYKSKKQEFQIYYDLLVGNDGANSNVRLELLKNVAFDFSQEYISHGYIELFFPAKENEKYCMDPNSLHIWPRNEFMLIALPNPKGSFTGTLFMPIKKFENIKNDKDIIKFFRKNFPDTVEMIGEDMLIKKYNTRDPSRMISIKCNRYNYKDSCVILGDSAHAMVPFYGQGMNCGLESVLIFHELLKENDYKLNGVCQKFSDIRPKDAHAMCDLAFYNYIEMRKLVNSKFFYIRTIMDKILYYFFPKHWIPLYTMVTFSRMPYSECLRRKEWQNNVIARVNNLTFLSLISGFLYSIWLYRHNILNFNYLYNKFNKI